jgi:hypothetical protein
MIGGFFKKRSVKDQRAINILALLSIILISVFCLKIFLDSSEKPNSQDNCFKHVSTKIAIILDKTDFIPEQTQAEIMNRSWATIKNNGKMGDLVSVYEVTQNSLSKLQPVFQMCLPKMGKESNELIENSNDLDKKFKEKFEKPLLAALSNNRGQAQNSPIAEALSDINLSFALKDAEQARILLFSDLMQHSSNVSTYGCTNADSAIEKFKQSRLGLKDMRPIFYNTYVELHIIPRQKMSEAEVKCRDKFWLWFFGKMPKNPNAKIGLSVHDLPGSYGAPIQPTPAS